MHIFNNRIGNRSVPFVKEVRKISDHITMVKLFGEIDLHTMPPIEKSLKEHREFLEQNTILDFSEVTHIDTATLAVLIYVFNQLKQHHRKICLIYINETVKEHIRIAKLDPLIHVYKTLDNAIGELSV